MGKLLEEILYCCPRITYVPTPQMLKFDQSSFAICFVALRPKSTAMVMSGMSVHLTTLFPGQA